MIVDSRPGLNAQRLVRLMRTSIARCKLDLSGYTVLTEAATGAYVVTPVLAAMAGADVCALASRTRYASEADLRAVTAELAKCAGVASRVRCITEKSAALVGWADIVTNSGQVRPIDAAMVSHMKPSCVIPLMYESWEFRESDLDLAACRARGIPVAGTNERHNSVDVFSFLGAMAIKQLQDAGIAVYSTRILLLCDNPFAPYIDTGLRNAGAEVTHVTTLTEETVDGGFDAILVAMQPHANNVLTAVDARVIGARAPGTVVLQYWGDVDRPALAEAGVAVWPSSAPARGHMGVLPSAIGPEPIVRLQAGGMKVGQVLANGLDAASADDRSLVQLL